MAIKMKGLLKGLRYISQIFDEEKKEPEIEIGHPTDVKHLAHIGSDGPSNNDLPSWMKEFKSEAEFQSPAIDSLPNHREDLRIRSSSEDSMRVNTAQSSPGNDVLELSKSCRRNSMTDKSGNESQKKKGSKSKQSRRQNSKEYSEGGSKSTRKTQETNLVDDSPSRNLPDIPKKTRRKKSKELVIDGGSSKSRSKRDTQYCENVSDSETILHRPDPPQFNHIPSLEGEEKGYR